MPAKRKADGERLPTRHTKKQKSPKSLRPQGSTQTACEQVWATRELCDDILLRLDLNNFLALRRVCKDWATSKLLRQVIYLAPIGNESTDKASSFLKPPIINPFLNSFLTDEYGPEFILDSASASKDDKDKDISEFKIVDRPFITKGILNEDFPFPKGAKVFHNPQSSIWNMQLTAPAIRKLRFVCTGYEIDEDGGFGGMEKALMKYDDNGFGDAVDSETNGEVYNLSNEHGVRVGQLVELLRSHKEVCPGCPLWEDELDPRESIFGNSPFYQWVVFGEGEARILLTAKDRRAAGLRELEEWTNKEKIEVHKGEGIDKRWVKEYGDVQRGAVPPGIGLTGHEVMDEVSRCFHTRMMKADA